MADNKKETVNKTTNKTTSNGKTAKPANSGKPANYGGKPANYGGKAPAAAKKKRKGDGSKIAISMLSFFLGIVFALVTLLGTIFGVGYTVLTTDINDYFNIAGIDNVDEDGNYVYLNTDEAGDIIELYKSVMGLTDLGTLTISKIADLVPAVNQLLDEGKDYVDGILCVEWDDILNVNVSSLMQVVNAAAFNLKTKPLLEKLGVINKYGVLGGSEDNTGEDGNTLNEIISTVALGGEARYVTVSASAATGGEEITLPVLWDKFEYTPDDQTDLTRKAFTRTFDQTTYEPDSKIVDGGYFSKVSSNTVSNVETIDYVLYYVPCKIDSDGKLSETTYTTKTLTASQDYDGDTVRFNYSVIEYGEGTVFLPVKANDSGDFVIDGTTDYTDTALRFSETYAKSYYNSNVKGSDGVFYVETCNNINYFKDSAGNVVEYDPLLLSDIMSRTYDSLYTLTLPQIIGGDSDSNSALLKDVCGDVSIGMLINGDVDYNSLIDDISLSVVVNGIDPTDDIMTFLIYKLSGVTKGEDGTYTATYDKGGDEEQAVTLQLDDDGKIDKVLDSNGNELKGTTVSDISTITEDLTLDIFLDAKADNAITSYIAYGLTDLTAASGTNSGGTYTYTGKVDVSGVATDVYVNTDSEGYITDVWYLNGTKKVTVSGTGIDDISSLMDNAMEKITLTDVLDVTADNNIIMCIAYGVTQLSANSGTSGDRAYTYTGYYEVNDVDYPAYVNTDSSGNVTSIWYEKDGTVYDLSGVKINDVASAVSDITDKLVITDVLDVAGDNNIMMYLGYGVTDVTANTDTSLDYNYSATHETYGTVYFTVDSSEYVTEAWYYVGTTKTTLSATKIGEISGKVEKITDYLAITDVLDVPADNDIMMYLAYSATDVTACTADTASVACDYSAKVKLDSTSDEETLCYFTVDSSGNVTKAWYYVGTTKTTLSATKIGKISDQVDGITDNLAITDVLDVSADNNIMMYIAYSATDVTACAADTASVACDYSAKVKLDSTSDVETLCYFTVDTNKYVTEAWYYDATVKTALPSTKIGKISDQVEGLQENMTIGDIISISDDNKVLKALGDATINTLDEKVQDLLVSDVLDVTADNKIMVYLAYGITDVTENAGTNAGGTYTHTGYYKVTDAENNVTTYPAYLYYDSTKEEVTSAWYINGETACTITGTKITEISDKVNDIKNDLAITDVMDVAASNKIMMYISYGVTGVTAAETGAIDDGGISYDYSAKVKLDSTSNVETLCYFTVDTSGNVTEAWYYDNGTKTALSATAINGISGKVDTLKSDMTIGDIIGEISPEDKVLYALKDYTIDELNDKVEELEITSVLDVTATSNIMMYVGYGVTGVTAAESGATDDGGISYDYSAKVKLDSTSNVETRCYFTVDENKYVTGAWYYDGNGEKATLSATKINEISDRVDGLTKDMTIGEIIDCTGTQILRSIKDAKISELGDTINELKVSDIFSEADIANNNILKHLQDAKITELADALDGLVIQEMYASEIYEGYQRAYGYASNVTYYTYDGTTYTQATVTSADFDDTATTEYYIYMGFQPAASYVDGYEYYTCTLKGGKYEYTADTTVTAETFATAKAEGTKYYVFNPVPANVLGYSSSDGTNSDYLYYTRNATTGEYELVSAAGYDVGHISEAMYNDTETTYYTYGKATGMWKLLLCDGNGKETAYPVTDLSDMITNCASTVKVSTLGELQDAGIIDSSSNLDKYLALSVGNTTQYLTRTGTVATEESERVKLKDLKLSELINVALTKLAAD